MTQYVKVHYYVVDEPEDSHDPAKARWLFNTQIESTASRPQPGRILVIDRKEHYEVYKVEYMYARRPRAAYDGDTETVIYFDCIDVLLIEVSHGA